MNIAVFDNSFPASGARGSFFEFIKYLKQKGHNLDLFVFSDYKETLYDTSPFINEKHIVEKKAFKYFNIRIYALDQLVNLVKLIFNIPSFKSGYAKLATKINDGDYDVVLVNVCDIFRAPYILRYLKVPSVFYCHHPNREAFEPAHIYFNEGSRANLNFLTKIYKSFCDWAIRSKNQFLAKIAIRNTRCATKVLTNSYYTREYLYKAYGLLAHVNYLGVDRTRFKSNGKARSNYILSVGGIEPNKRFIDIIKAVSLLDKKDRPAVKIVGGRKMDQTYDEIVSLAKKNDVELEVLLGIKDQDLINAYNEAKMVVFVPLMEPFGLVSLEAMACGTPVIGVREGGLRESIVDQETGLLVDRNPNQLADAIKRLNTDTKLWNKFSENGIQSVQSSWTWEKATDRLENHLKEAILSKR